MNDGLRIANLQRVTRSAEVIALFTSSETDRPGSIHPLRTRRREGRDGASRDRVHDAVVAVEASGRMSR